MNTSLVLSKDKKKRVSGSTVPGDPGVTALSQNFWLPKTPAREMMEDFVPILHTKSDLLREAVSRAPLPGRRRKGLPAT